MINFRIHRFILQLRYDTKPTTSDRRKRTRDNVHWRCIVYVDVKPNLYWNKKADRLRARFEKWR